MQSELSQTISASGSDLVVQAVSLTNGQTIRLPARIAEIWKDLAPFAIHPRQVMYIRDLAEQSIDGKYVGGFTPNGKETFINMPHWDVSEEELTNSIAHELHHLVRWHGVGYGATLGEAITTEGVACVYAAQQSDWKAPWTDGVISKELRQHALQEWDSEQYHHPQWFFGSKDDRWAGYRLGHQLVSGLSEATQTTEALLNLTQDRIRPSLEAGESF